MKSFNFWFVLLLLLALAVRIYNLSSLPKSLSMDEVTFGYAAYSVMHTGQDEYGKFLPLAFQGLGDFKPPIDVYIKVPFIFLFGLNEFSIRLPGVMFGVATIYFLVKLARKNKISDISALLAGLWLALSPWHIFYSRGGYEAISALFFLVAGLYAFSNWLDSKKYKYFISFLILFSLSLWSYHAERILIPILTLFMFSSYYKELFKLIQNKKNLIKAIFVLFLFVIPFVYGLLISKDITPRAQDLWFAKEINGNFYQITRGWIGQYLQYFDLRFITTKALMLTPNGYPDLGLINIFDFVLVIISIYSIINIPKKNFLLKIAILLSLLGPIPAAFARGVSSQIRILVWVPAFFILIAQGIKFLYKKNLYTMLIPFWVVALVINFFYFFYIYKNNFDKYYGDLWHYGYKEVAQYACENYNSYSKIILTDKYGIEISRIKTIPTYYLLFHCRYEPERFLQTKKVYNVEVRQPHWIIDSKEKGNLLIGSPRDFPEGFPEDKIIKKIYFPNGKEAFFIVKT